MRVYVSGKVTGLPYDETKEKFAAAAKQVELKGHTPVDPMALVPFNKDWDWSKYMLADIELLFACDGIFMLPDWGNSKGARIEHSIAMHHGICVFYDLSEMPVVI